MQFTTKKEAKDNWYDAYDQNFPYKVVYKGCDGVYSSRFEQLENAKSLFEVCNDRALLLDHSNKETKVLAYKYPE